MLFSPSEPAVLRALGHVSPECEARGADILLWSQSHGGWMGVQRKEMNDLVASLGDGRLAEQVTKMGSSVNQPVLLIEGKGRWSSDGQWMGEAPYRMRWSGLQKLLMTVRQSGCWVVETERMTGPCSTVEWLEMTDSWVTKDRHVSLDGTRGPVPRSWGSPNNRDYQRHLLMGLPGMGPTLADRVLDGVGMPLTWRDGVLEGMLRVDGVGQKKIETWTTAVPVEVVRGENRQ